MQISDYFNVIFGCLIFLIIIAVLIYFNVNKLKGGKGGTGKPGGTEETPASSSNPDLGGRRRYHRRSRR